jgi:hypothetical protein
MDHAFALEALGKAQRAHQLDGTALEDTGPDSGKNMCGRLTFDNDTVDTGANERVAKHQSGRTCADDRDLGG